MTVLLLGWWWVRKLKTISKRSLCVHFARHPGFDLLLLLFQSLLTFLVVFVVDSEVSSNYRYRQWSKHQACQHYQYSESVSEPVSGIEVTISYCGHCNNSPPVPFKNMLRLETWCLPFKFKLWLLFFRWFYILIGWNGRYGMYEYFDLPFSGLEPITVFEFYILQ